VERLPFQPLHLFLGESKAFGGAGQGEGVVLAEAELQHLLFNRLELAQLAVQPAVVLLVGQGGGHRDQVPQAGVGFLPTHRLIEGDGMGLVGDPEHEGQPLLALPQAGGQFGEAQVAGLGGLQEAGLHRQGGDLGRQADGAALLLEIAIHGLTDPPISIGGKPITTAWRIALDRTDQTEGSGLNHIQWINLKMANPRLIVARYRHHKPQVGGHHTVHRPATATLQGGCGAWVGEPFLHHGSEVKFLGRGEQGEPADAVQIITECIRHRDSLGRHLPIFR
jgi:hypothetical protein